MLDQAVVRPHPPVRRLQHRIACPHCSSQRVVGHGSFPRKAAPPQQRYRCCDCRRTFCQHTCTPLYYIKKHDRWEQLARGMAQKLSVRRLAAALHVQPATAFSWRHRLLTALLQVPQPTLSGVVAASEAFVRYSEKGSRHTYGPGAYGIRCGKRTPPRGKERFRPFKDGKPSRLLLTCVGEQKAVSVVSRGWPTLDELQNCLSRVVRAGAELWAFDLIGYVEACRNLRISVREIRHLRGCDRQTQCCSLSLSRLRGQLYAWLHRFFGVATKYLENYLAWFRFNSRTARLSQARVGWQLLAETNTPVPPGHLPD